MNFSLCRNVSPRWLSWLARAVTVCVLFAWGAGRQSCFAAGNEEGSSAGNSLSGNVDAMDQADDRQSAEVPGAFYLKTSIPAWGAAIVNAAGEWGFARRWSLGLGVAYSAWDYGQSIRKFRTFSLRPEIRYWPCGDRHGFFVEGHLAMIYYNVALPDWEWRIQDVGGNHPALGGGIGVGYRFDLSDDRRWRGEVAIGGGVYHLDYDRFENRPGGKLHDTVSRTWAGIDHVAFSLVYVFNL